MTVEKIGFSEKSKLEITCKNCGSILTFLKMDIKTHTHWCVDEFSESKYIECIECKNKVYLKE